MSKTLKLADYLGKPFDCSCGRTHSTTLEGVTVSAGAMKALPEYVEKYGFKNLYIACDEITYGIAGEKVMNILKDAGIKAKAHVFKGKRFIPDEKALGELMIDADRDCDLVVAVGTGSINDMCRFFSFQMGVPYAIVATAAPMDGFASSGAALIINSMKTTIPAQTPLFIIGDTDILCGAPARMVSAGLGDLLGKFTCLNDWRISKVVNDEYYCDEIVNLVTDCIENVLADADNVASRDPKVIGDIMEGLVLTGVAMSFIGTMMHMLLGTDARSIGRSPYQPAFLGAQKRSAGEIGLRAGMDNSALVYCLPQVSAFIGADIVAGAYVCELEKQNGNVLFIDIGTNGEIVLSQKGRLLCCSCAAGPALEGMNISCGMRAAEGAIEDVKITEHGVECTCIDGKEPVGICGSGILAVLKELIRTGLVRKNGAFVKKENIPEEDYRYPMIRMNGKKREFLICEAPELVVTQGDIRQVQLAKGAILSGFLALLNKAGISMEELDKVMIAGQFGAHLPAESLTGTGILPKEVEDKIIYVGNSSKTGAYMTLLSEQVKEEMEGLAERMEYIELAETENYEKIFAESMRFV